MPEPSRLVNRETLARWLLYGEDGIYVAAGVLLAVTSAFILASTAMLVVETVRAGELADNSIRILDMLLLVLLIVEIMHTIRVSIVEHALLAEPFLVVALIAGVRRVLILTVEAAELLPEHPEQFDRVLLEMVVLIGLFVVVVGSLTVLRRLGRTPRRKVDG